MLVIVVDTRKHAHGAKRSRHFRVLVSPESEKGHRGVGRPPFLTHASAGEDCGLYPNLKTNAGSPSYPLYTLVLEIQSRTISPDRG
jgi:hypothetical protein